MRSAVAAVTLQPPLVREVYNISYITLTQSRELHVTGYFVARCVRAMDLFFCVYTLLDYELIPEFLLVPTSASTILEARAVLIFRKFTLCCTYHHTELIYTELIYTELIYTELTLQPTLIQCKERKQCSYGEQQSCYHRVIGYGNILQYSIILVSVRV